MRGVVLVLCFQDGTPFGTCLGDLISSYLDIRKCIYEMESHTYGRLRSLLQTSCQIAAREDITRSLLTGSEQSSNQAYQPSLSLS